MGEVVILRRSRIMVAIPVPQRNFHAALKASWGGQEDTHNRCVQGLPQINAGHKCSWDSTELLGAEDRLTHNAGNTGTERICKSAKHHRENHDGCGGSRSIDDEQNHTDGESNAGACWEDRRAKLVKCGANAQHHKTGNDGVYGVPVCSLGSSLPLWGLVARETAIRSRSEEKKAIFSLREALIKWVTTSDGGL